MFINWNMSIIKKRFSNVAKLMICNEHFNVSKSFWCLSCLVTNHKTNGEEYQGFQNNIVHWGEGAIVLERTRHWLTNLNAAKNHSRVTERQIEYHIRDATRKNKTVHLITIAIDHDPVFMFFYFFLFDFFFFVFFFLFCDVLYVLTMYLRLLWMLIYIQKFSLKFGNQPLISELVHIVND